MKNLDSIYKEIKQAIRARYITTSKLQEVNSKIWHAVIKMLWANGLFLLINKVLSKNVIFHRLQPDVPLTNALSDAMLMIKMVV